MNKYSKDSRIIDVLREVPGSLDYLMRKGICGLSCLDPDLGTIRSAAARKGYKEKEIENIIEELNILNLNKAAGSQGV